MLVEKAARPTAAMTSKSPKSTNGSTSSSLGSPASPSEEGGAHPGSPSVGRSSEQAVKPNAFDVRGVGAYSGVVTPAIATAVVQCDVIRDASLEQRARL